jgi:hypothetical protein
MLNKNKKISLYQRLSGFVAVIKVCQMRFSKNRGTNLKMREMCQQHYLSEDDASLFVAWSSVDESRMSRSY